MNWANAALLSAAILAIVNVLDSHLVSKRFPSLRSFLLIVGIIQIAYGLSLALLQPLPDGVSSTHVGYAVLSSLVRTAAIIILLDALQHGEVSTVIPVVYTYPVFVAIIAFVFLGERLEWQQWLAIAIVVVGVVLISMRRAPSRIQIGRTRSALVMLCSPLFACADVMGKVALEQITFWNLFWIGAAVMGGVFVAVSLRRSTLQCIAALHQGRISLGLLIGNEVLAPVGVVISYWALEHGPVSLVSTLVGTRPLFVLLYALVLSRFAPEFLFWSGGRNLVIMRVLATGLIVAGVAVIELTSGGG